MSNAIGPVVERPLWNTAIKNVMHHSIGFASKLDRMLHQRSELLLASDLAYVKQGHARQVCDIWAPQGSNRLLPSVFFVHGGSFRSLSKETFWMYGQRYAERGFVVCLINYRLAPEHPCPVAILDVQRAYNWWVDNAEKYGADPERIVVSGESAGANLALGLTLALYNNQANYLVSSQHFPKLCVPSCGIYDPSNPERFTGVRGKKWLPDLVLKGLENDYQPNRHPLGSPLNWLEEQKTPVQLPHVEVIAGTRDSIVSDSHRLIQVLVEKNLSCNLTLYDAGHCFPSGHTQSAKLFWSSIGERMMHAFG